MDPKKPKLPKDLGIKIGTKEEAYWTLVKEKTEIELKSLEMELNKNLSMGMALGNSIKLSKGIIEYANNKILEEEKK